jgi:HAD superfamily hydrolase (TIGR01509 family)
MILNAPVSALIFDFDGVLADTEALHCAAFQAVLADIGLQLSEAEYFELFLGLPDRECLAAACAREGQTPSAADIDTLLARKRARFAQLAQSAALYPGVAPVLRCLHERFTLAIASGAFRDEIETILERAGVRELFAAIIGAEDVREGKPAPDPFVAALQALKHNGARLSAADCVAIEDSPRGIAAAHAAGMRCIAVATSHERSVLGAADAIIEHLSQLRPEDLRA